MRWSLSLQSYHFTIEHRLGNKHTNADGLSRQRFVEPDTREEGGGVRDCPLEIQDDIPDKPDSNPNGP